MFLILSLLAGGSSETPLSAWLGVVVSRVLGLGVVVILTFAILWAPFCIVSDVAGGEGCFPSLKQARGLECAPACPSASQDCFFSSCLAMGRALISFHPWLFCQSSRDVLFQHHACRFSFLFLILPLSTSSAPGYFPGNCLSYRDEFVLSSEWKPVPLSAQETASFP